MMFPHKAGNVARVNVQDGGRFLKHAGIAGLFDRPRYQILHDRFFSTENDYFEVESLRNDSLKHGLMMEINLFDRLC